MRGRLTSALGLALALGGAAPAAAAEHRIQGRDTLTWSPARITIASGDTVTWSFTGTRQAHNVRSASSNWNFASPIGAPAPSASYTFTAEGRYDFYCQVHPTTMRGSVTVGAATPPPPPPDGSDPYPNDSGAPARYERLDKRPRITGVRARRSGRGARVRFRLSERARVIVRAKRGGRTAGRKSVSLRRGRRAVRLRGLRPGAYRLVLVARDRAGNRSRVKRARVVVR